MNKTMKLIIIVTVLVACVSAINQAQMERASAAVTACIGENNVTPAEVLKLQRIDFSGTPSQNVQCLARCFFERVGFMQNGVFNEANIRRELTVDVDAARRAVIEAALNQCRSQTGSNTCETAYNSLKCYAQARLVNV